MATETVSNVSTERQVSMDNNQPIFRATFRCAITGGEFDVWFHSMAEALEAQTRLEATMVSFTPSSRAAYDFALLEVALGIRPQLRMPAESK